MESVGKYTYGTENIHITPYENNAKLTIGSFCSIADNVKIFLGGNHRTDWVTTYPFGHIHQNVFTKKKVPGHPATKGDVVIGNDVWLASGVTIMSGITIGDGSVIGACSLVVKDVEPYSIVGGNPGKHLKYKFSKDQIEKLLKIKWWEWEDDKINENTPLLCQNDIDLFINKHL